VGCASGPPEAAVTRQIATVRTSASISSERLAEPVAVDRFYKARHSKPAWLDRSDDIVAAIQGMQADGLDPADYHLEAIQALLAKGKSSLAPSDAGTLDVLLADAVAGMADDVRYGRVRPSEVNPQWNADPRDDAPPLDSTLAVIAAAGSVAKAIDAQRPSHFIYRGLMSELDRLRKIEASGGWPSVRSGINLKPGAINRRVAEARRWLIVDGEISGGAARDSSRYDPKMVEVVKAFQAHHRIRDRGILDSATTDAMNVSAQARIGQVRVNLERARWVLGGLDDGFLLVNLPAFKAYLIRGNQNVWESRTQIGDEAMQTPSFRATIRTLVFNPDWTVPKSIIANEILEDMRNGKNVIDKQGLVIYDASNNVVDPSSINWKKTNPEAFPYTIRQPSGQDNALGKVKFLFPNKYSIYLHDTPSRHLFEAERRTFSHGCIRIENPLELAKLLLEGQADAGQIAEWTASDSLRNVAIEHPMPIVIVYWTVSIGASGEVHVADDIYGLDAPLLAALDRSVRRAPRVAGWWPAPSLDLPVYLAAIIPPTMSIWHT
jgi:murein L,D-transpeptidase YcbB/YkuD